MRRVLLACAALVMMVMVSPAAVQAAEQTPSCQATLDSYLDLTAGTSVTMELLNQENVLLTAYLNDGCDWLTFVNGVMSDVTPENRPQISAALGLGENATNYQIYCEFNVQTLAALNAARERLTSAEHLAKVDMMIQNIELLQQIPSCLTAPQPVR